jgi:hypothetical protein
VPAEKFTAVSFRESYPPRRVAPHEMLLAFDRSNDAMDFRTWWEVQGAEVFAVWLKAERRCDAGDDNDKLTPGVLAGVSAADLGELMDGPPPPKLPPEFGELKGNPADEIGRCSRCGGRTAHYRLKGYQCPRCS